MDSSNTVTAVIVDDNFTEQKSFEIDISNGPLKVYTTGNPAEAILLASHLAPAFIISDLYLPDPVAGLEFIANIKNEPALSKIPVYIVTFTLNEVEERQSLQAGAAGYFRKPVTRETLYQLCAATGRNRNKNGDKTKHL